MRTAGAAALLLLALPAVAPAAGGAPAPCRSAQLRLVFKRSDGAAGTMYELLRLQPRAGVSCTMTGYPGASVLGRHRRPLPIVFTREPGSLNPVSTRTYTARHPARFDLRHPSADPRTTRPCSIRAYYFRVIPPGETRALTVSTGRHPRFFCRAGARVTPVGSHY